MLLQKIRKELKSLDHRFTAVEGIVAAGYFDADYETLNEADAKVVEGSKLAAIDVAIAEASGFTAFLDGIQRAEVKFCHDSVPILYAYGAAVVRERIDRALRTLRRSGAEALAERHALFFPSEHVPRQSMPTVAGVELVDITPEGSERLPLFPPLLYARAKQFVNRWRERIEAEVAGQWCNTSDGWLLIDGSIAISEATATSRAVAGIIKSHRTRFFDGDDARVMLNLRVGQRTSMFQPAIRPGRPVRSWYLRVRPADLHDPFWGLVRIEVAASHSAGTADLVSSWLLAETRPLSLPDARWDRLMYPIHDCEEYLRARAPRL